MEFTYKQKTKSIVRHKVLSKAVSLLTNQRYNACCVEKEYVRNLYDYFCNLDEEKDQLEAEQIEIDYIKEWERIHTINLSQRLCQ